MVPNLTMTKWSEKTEEQLILFIKDWLKQIGKNQSDLCQYLKLPSTRMPVLIEALKKEFISGGIPKVATRLCEIEHKWLKDGGSVSTNIVDNSDPFGQLDLLYDEICEDCDI